MLAGLEAVGITGLALLPDGLRHLFAFGDPVLSSADVEGRTIRALRSDTIYALIEALGARPDDANGDAFFERIASGEIVAAESSYALAQDSLPVLSTATGNLTLFPKVNSLVTSSEVFDDLSSDHREVLRSAAVGAREWAISNAVPDAHQAAGFCEYGGRVVLATDAQIAAFEEAGQPVYAELEQDDTTKALIERIRELKADMPAPATPKPCEPEPEFARPVEADAADTAAFPGGVYRLEVTQDDLRAFGVTNPDDLQITTAPSAGRSRTASTR